MDINIEITETVSCHKIVQIFKNLSKFTDFIQFQFMPDKLYSQGMDGTKSAIFELSIFKEWFNVYHVTSSTILTLNTLILAKIFSIHNDNQKININYEDGSDFINISFVGSDTYIRKFTLPLTDIVEFNNITIKHVEHDFEFMIQTKILSNMVEQLRIFDENLIVQCDEKYIVFASNGDDGEMKCILYDTDENIDNVEEYVCIEDTKFEASYGIKLFSIMCSFDKLASHVNLCFNDDIPMNIKYKLGYESELSFYLAPKLSD